MVESLRDVCGQGVAAYPGRPREAWVLDWPGQVILVVSAIFWTADVAAAMKSTSEGEHVLL